MKLYSCSAVQGRRYFAQVPKLDLRTLGDKWREKTLKGVPTLSRDDRDKNIYVLCMFPYPSGMLHIGHLRVYTISDVLNRFYQMNGYNVLHPMGWDAFGLPAENAAIDRGISPATWTKQNIEKMKEQMNLMLANFEWKREVTTCDPEYYKHTQRIFLELFKHGYAYRKEAEINWDPVDQTVLANEQVDSNGCSWRSGAKVEKRLLSQWFLGITKFAHELQNDLNYLDNWPAHVKRMQKNWIGESKGVEVVFNTPTFESIKVFTTRAETLYSVQFLTLAPDHDIVKHLKKEDAKLSAFLKKVETLAEDSKEGFLLPGVFAVHPLNKSIKLPVFVAPYVIGNYGHGAVMGCPAHDARDFEFWNENMPGKPIIFTVSDKEGSHDPSVPYLNKDGIMNENSAELRGLTATEARKKVAEKLECLNLGKTCTQYKLRDWLISRQRYWGAPIPIIHCDSCGPVAVPDDQLPVKLPDTEVLSRVGNPLSKMEEFVSVDCPSCGKPARRETDTMDTFMDSSWYFFRYTDPHNSKQPFSFDKASNSMPVDIYIGGVEHAILHLLYSRFISKFTASIGMWDGHECQGEPFKRLITQGMVHGKTYIDPESNRFLKPEEVDITISNKPKIISSGKDPLISYEKMSKSKYNGANPAECIAEHGVDATRAHILFQAPVSDVLNWDESKIVGIERWLERIIKLSVKLSSESINPELVCSLESLNNDELSLHNKTQNLLTSINKSFRDIYSLNTVISDYMKLTNLLEDSSKNDLIRKELVLFNLQKLVTILYPVCPSISEEAVDILASKGFVWDNYNWPQVEPTQESDVINYRVVINGKMRFLHGASNTFVSDEKSVIEELKSLAVGKKYLQDKEIKKIIIKGKIISLVLK